MRKYPKIHSKPLLFFWFLSLGLLATSCSLVFPPVRYESSDPKALHHIGSDLYGAYEPFVKTEVLQHLSYTAPWERGGPADAAIEKNEKLFTALKDRIDVIASAMEAQAEDLRRKGKLGEPVTLKLLLWLHGGLNYPSVNDERLVRLMAQVNQASLEGYYPLLVSWRSGAFVSISDHYTKVRNGGLAQGPAAYLRGGFYLTTDLLTGAAALPETLWDQSADFLSANEQKRRQYPNLPGYDSQVFRDRQSFADYFSPNSNVAYWEGGFPDTPGQKAFLWTKSLLPGVVRLGTTPLLQGLGSPAWQMMLRRATNLTTMEADALGIEDHYGDAPAGDATGNGLVAVLARRLGDIQKDFLKKGITLEVVLVGHSMGAIVANDLVHDFPNLPYTRIIHMAAADSVRNWMDKTAPWLRNHPRAEFYNLVLHPTNEEREDFTKVSILPTGSLLVWLDEMFTKPDHLLDRRSGRWANAKYLLPMYKKLANSHLKVFPLNQKDVPDHHGGFSDFAYWTKAFYWFDERAPVKDSAPLKSEVVDRG